MGRLTHTPTPPEISGNDIKQARQRAGMSHTDLALALIDAPAEDVAAYRRFHSTLRNIRIWESNQRKPDTMNRTRLHEVLGI